MNRYKKMLFLPRNQKIRKLNKTRNHRKSIIFIYLIANFAYNSRNVETFLKRNRRLN